MVSDIITISSSGANMDAALEETAKVAAHKSLSRKDALHLRLLSTSSSGKNEASRGFFGRLRDFIFRGPDENIAAYELPQARAGIAANVKDWQWSMNGYRETMSNARDVKPEVASRSWAEEATA